ncbi:carboxypeptidase [Candidatus Marinamargulisbacteria bacterium SCGC AG-414-C22]|nr:carboxypeptidase [Candidatus Marinamargulisbacteria bacterium SCGC AG-414-C22]
MKSIKLLHKNLVEIAQLKAIRNVLHWDQEIMMPKGAIQFRSQQMALVSKLIYEQFTGTNFKAALATHLDLDTGNCKDIQQYSEQEVVILKTVYKDWKKAVCIPVSFATELAELTSQSTHIWARARQENDFNQFKPYLEKLVEMQKQYAAYIDASKQPYDVLLDLYEPGLTAQKVSSVFDPLRDETVALLKRIQKSKKSFKTIQGTFDKQQQWKFSLQLLNQLGYDFDKGRQDISTHPFTIDFHPSDVRITTRINTNDPLEAITSTIHEAGHAFYEMGLDPKWFGTPLGEACSLGVHESQSRFWENHIGLSSPFWKTQFEELKRYFPEPLSNINALEFYEYANQIKPGPIRVEADELTYNLHILIRFECEQAIFNDNLDIKDLPALWNKKYKEYLGINIQSDAEGVLQDIHWAGGSFGYFPTYTLGTLYAAQINEKLELEFPDYHTLIQQLDFKSLKEWLTNHIHQFGRFYDPEKLMQQATGQSLSIQPFVNYLHKKYQSIYSL